MKEERPVGNGFTLIEIIAVLAVIAAFLGLVGPNYLKSIDKGRAKAAAAQINSLEGMLGEYKLENGAYPSTEQGLDALYRKPTVPPVPDNWDGPYAKKPITKDPWGRPYVYRCPGEHNPDGYDLFSYGADGAEGGAGVKADITNWEAE